MSISNYSAKGRNLIVIPQILNIRFYFINVIIILTLFHQVTVFDCRQLRMIMINSGLPLDTYFPVCYSGGVYGNQRTTNENITCSLFTIKR